MLGNICVVIISFPIGEFINFKITIAFLSSRFPIWSKKSGQKSKYQKNEKSIRAFNIKKAFKVK